jgi:thioredoxin reductase (NADPH)
MKQSDLFLPEIVMYGAEWCPDCQRAKAYLDEHEIEYIYRDIEISEQGVARVEEINEGKRIIPTLEIGEKHYSNPDNAQLGCLLGINPQGRILFYGADWCPDCRRAKSYLDDNGIHYQFIDIESDDRATQTVEKLNNGKSIIPTILIDDELYANPDNPTLREALDVDESKAVKEYDVIVIGAGAAGLTTSIYTQREKLSTAILEKKNIGGNAYLTEKIENYPGFTSISGPELMNKMAEQTKVYGTEINQGTEVWDIKPRADDFMIETNMGPYRAKSIVVSVGSTYRRLHIPGEDELLGSGIHFCATCDGPFYKGQDVIVIGGGNSALEESIYLSEFVNSVTIVNLTDSFTAAETYLEKLKTRDNITSLMNRESLEFLPDQQGLLKGLRVRHTETGEEEIIDGDGAFIFIGLKPNTSFLSDLLDMDDAGFIKTPAGDVHTNVPGIFAAGDCRKGATAQIASATGEGVVASYAIKNYLSNR